MPPWRRQWLMIFRFVFVVALVATLTMTLWPHYPAHTFSLWRKFGDFTAFAALTLVTVIAFPHARLIRLGEILSGLAAVIEVGQGLITVGRDANIFDWMIETGVIAVVLLLSAPPAPIGRDRPDPRDRSGDPPP